MGMRALRNPAPREPRQMVISGTDEPTRRLAGAAPLARRRFGDRREAGRALARALAGRGYEKPVALAIATGGLVLAAEVAAALDAELALTVTRRLRAPYQPGLTLGAVTADNVSWIHAGVAEEVGASNGYLAAEIQRSAREARRLERELGIHARPPVRGRTALVVDDGIVTGARAIAALRAARQAGARLAVFAAAVGPPEAFDRVRGASFEVFSLVEDPRFVSVGDFFDDFRPVSGPQAREILAAAASRPSAS